MAMAEAEQGAMRHESGLRLLAGAAGPAAVKARIRPPVCAIGTLASADSDPAQRETGISLAGYLIRMRTLGEKARVRLEEEISLAESYLEIGRIWFGSRLWLEAAIDPDARDCLVPPLVLLPLLDPVAQFADAGVARLEARRVGQRLRIVVESPLDSEPPRSRAKPNPARGSCENDWPRLTAQMRSSRRSGSPTAASPLSRYPPGRLGRGAVKS